MIQQVPIYPDGLIFHQSFLFPYLKLRVAFSYAIISVS
uniref:Uncharacterized protein n=1 Tax=Rhizobium rhizogenes TaxID=359 RepID=A0A7S4ZTP9_RHIRH|nr:hypothetical protein pC5.7b_313 [Rhizobium rhizogenes]